MTLGEEARMAPDYFAQNFASPTVKPVDPYIYDDIKTIADHFHYIGATPHSGNGRSDAAGGGHAHAGMLDLSGR